MISRRPAIIIRSRTTRCPRATTRRMLVIAFALGAIVALAAGCSEHGDHATSTDATRVDPGSGSGSGDQAAGDRGPRSADRIRQSAMHKRHLEAKPSIKCEACHEKVAGEYLRAKSWPCQQCHADKPLALHVATPTDSPAHECWSCHDFTRTDAKVTSCTSCHDKAQGNLPAIKPHDPKKPDENCSSCHRAHEQPSLASTRCEDCHKEPVSGHDKPPIPIHGCASCHGFHEPASTASTRCTNCHKQSRARVPHTATFTKKDGKGHVKCVTCHRQHRFKKEQVLGCREECHRGQVAISENKVEKHKCLGCHDNHDVLASAPKSCVTCHAGKINPTHPKDPVSKTECIGCHKPHAGPRAPLAVACSSCHRKASSDRGFHQGADHGGPACRDCHKPHAFNLKGLGIKLCLGCHGEHPFKNAKTIRPYGEHKNCFGCHGDTVRHQPAGPRKACTTCHTDKAPIIRKGHAKCVGCHDPHTTKQAHPCGDCHKHEASIARKDHKNCTNCHNPHTGLQKRPCGSCHQAEAASAPEKHQQCTNCHDQHSTLQKRTCGSCHTDRTTGVHKNVPGGCINCHRPHGPNGHAKPPACTTCHKNLPLLHQASGHKECTKCHRSHGEQPYRHRETCIACHKDRKDHQPAAPLCIGCHTFGGGQ